MSTALGMDRTVTRAPRIPNRARGTPKSTSPGPSTGYIVPLIALAGRLPLQKHRAQARKPHIEHYPVQLSNQEYVRLLRGWGARVAKAL